MTGLRLMERQDYEMVRTIFQQGIDTGYASLESTAPNWQTFNEKYLLCCRYVFAYRDEVVGWAAITPYSPRKAYAGVAEVSVYVAKHFRGRGVGKQLLQRIITGSEDQGFWTLQAAIFPENTASIALHKRLGFNEVGLRNKLGRRPDGKWQDILLLERRSLEIL